ncbi:MAG: FHA domain-containing protein [Nitrososphaerota archaeon]
MSSTEKTASMIIGVILAVLGILTMFLGILLIIPEWPGLGIFIMLLGVLFMVGGGLLINNAMKPPAVQPSPPSYVSSYTPPPGTKIIPRGDTITITYPGGGTQTLSALLQIDGRSIPVTTLPQTFGRSNFIGIVQDSSLLNYISNQHFTIGYDFTNGNFLIWDNDSKNGTYLNGVDIRRKGPQILRNGDMISVAKVLNIRFTSS